MDNMIKWYLLFSVLKLYNLSPLDHTVPASDLLLL
jgi:hypothetical protein